mmetsp:Transcript_78053/g.154681  ORF Transcript_78053/g.154681 Transcript_78053/m.154681 type:complete len:335 (-) Transcript_78053:105-1109(-)|eukprot:CAMPEP_0172727678 /NCGR_PEP_ID=MMETSP1074-20121228/91815_1 /TAXON_ID=2916 /ORGANISM="Ceratium fusus, Strain PA161109" /LENGTH=334 /DNA_ID=CAMNT_0013554851 /DNA_START=138 /DNA_END=1142 /DNA_ORIENTATION=+
MDKRGFEYYDGEDDEHDEKRYRYVEDAEEARQVKEEESESVFGVADLDGVQHLEAEFFVEQSLIGWLIGTAGATVKEVERQFQVNITVDQASKALGYSKVKVKGSASMVQKAAEHMNASLAVATQNSHNGATEVGPFLTDVPPINAKPPDQGHAYQSWDGPHIKEEAMQVDQQWVGWLLGKSGGVAREIEQITGAKVSINQSTRALGYSTVKVSGEPEALEAAKARISASLERMLGAPASEHYVTATATSGGSASIKVKIEQQWVGWLVGKSGAVVNEIETATGAKLSMNQETKALGYSTCTISGSTEAVEQASMQVSDKLRQVDPNFAGLQAA